MYLSLSLNTLKCESKLFHNKEMCLIYDNIYSDKRQMQFVVFLLMVEFSR